MSKIASTQRCSDHATLPAIHRTIRMPESLWGTVKERSQREGKAVRWVIDDVLDAELGYLIDALQKAGLDGQEEKDKLVRMPLDDNVIARLNYGRRQTGLPAVEILRLCLRRHIVSKLR